MSCVAPIVSCLVLLLPAKLFQIIQHGFLYILLEIYTIQMLIVTLLLRCSSSCEHLSVRVSCLSV